MQFSVFRGDGAGNVYLKPADDLLWFINWDGLSIISLFPEFQGQLAALIFQREEAGRTICDMSGKHRFQLRQAWKRCVLYQLASQWEQDPLYNWAVSVDQKKQGSDDSVTVEAGNPRHSLREELVREMNTHAGWTSTATLYLGTEMVCALTKRPSLDEFELSWGDEWPGKSVWAELFLLIGETWSREQFPHIVRCLASRYARLEDEVAAKLADRDSVEDEIVRLRKRQTEIQHEVEVLNEKKRLYSPYAQTVGEGER